MRNNNNIFTFIFYVIGAVFFFITDDIKIAILSETWRPISFYNLLSGPLSFGILFTLKFCWLITSLMAGLGYRFRATSIITFLTGLIYLGHGYNYGHVYHGTQLYIMSAGIISFFGKTEMALSYIRYYVVFVLFLCGVQKLYYGGGLSWVFSENFYLRVFINPNQTKTSTWILSQELWVSQLMAFFALVVVELFSPIILLIYKKYLGATVVVILTWTLFHLMVSLTFGGHLSFFSQVFCYMSFLKLDAVPLILKLSSNALLNKYIK